MTVPAFCLLRQSARSTGVTVRPLADLAAWDAAVRDPSEPASLAVASVLDGDGRELADTISVLPAAIVSRKRIVILLDYMSTGRALHAARVRERITDLIDTDQEPAMDLLTAHAHDPAGHACCADALRLLLRRWGPVSDSLLRCSIGSRFACGSVKAAVSAFATDRWTLGRHLRAEGAASPGRVLDAAVLAVAVLLGWRTAWPHCRIARYLRFADERPLNAASVRALGIPFADLRDAQADVWRDRDIDRVISLLDQYVSDFGDATGRGDESGNGGTTYCRGHLGMGVAPMHCTTAVSSSRAPRSPKETACDRYRKKDG